jgi:hypothetical protein
MFLFFCQQVKRNLHFVLAMRPNGKFLGDRIREYPSLINCCGVDYFGAWPSEALTAVARTNLAVKIEEDESFNALALTVEEADVVVKIAA